MPKIAIIDYGMGNLQSVRNAFEYVGCEVTISNNLLVLAQADGLVLPGVGAFGEAMQNLQKQKLIDPLQRMVLDEKKPLLGICLGMQLLADSSDERGKHTGLSLIPGQVKAIAISRDLRLPHIGWNSTIFQNASPLFEGLHDEEAFYFVHSYYFDCHPDYISSVTYYGSPITAAVYKDHIFGVQFHPERSHHKGLKILKNFANYVFQSAQ